MKTADVHQRGRCIGFLGEPNPATRTAWSHAFPGWSIVSLPRVAHDGRRLGNRLLGLGVDALRLALRLRMLRAQHVVAMNPWTGVACRILGIRSVACVGIYAVPRSGSWRTLRGALGNAPIVTTSRTEARAWVKAGGRAHAVLWGGDFPCTPSAPPDGAGVRLFLGGTSDRDPQVVRRLVQALSTPAAGTSLHIADGTGPRTEGVATWYGRLSNGDFHQLLSSCHAVLLPLTPRGRAAGHMVLCAALQAGQPVVASRVEGIEEYLAVLQREAPLGLRCDDFSLASVHLMAQADGTVRAQLRDTWLLNFSSQAFASRAREALQSLDWPPAPST